MRLGLITTGQGPRDQYAVYHQRLARTLGLSIETEMVHILDELDWPAIEPHLAKPGEDVLGAHVRVPGATGNRLGPGWAHVYVGLVWSIPYFQAAIDRLVARGADCILLCCATKFDDGAFRSPVPLIRPSTMTFAVVAEMARATDRLRLGLMSSAGHAVQDVALWQGQSFADRLDIAYEPFEGDLLPAAERLSKSRRDLVVVWSYGLGTHPADPAGLTARLEKDFACPVLMPHRIAALHAMAVIPSGFDDGRYAI